MTVASATSRMEERRRRRTFTLTKAEICGIICIPPERRQKDKDWSGAKIMKKHIVALMGVMAVAINCNAQLQESVSLQGLDTFQLPSGTASDPNGTYVFKENIVVPFPWNPSSGWTTAVYTNSNGWEARQDSGGGQITFLAPEDSGYGRQAFWAVSDAPPSPYPQFAKIGGTFSNDWTPSGAQISTDGGNTWGPAFGGGGGGSEPSPTPSPEETQSLSSTPAIETAAARLLLIDGVFYSKYAVAPQ